MNRTSPFSSAALLFAALAAVTPAPAAAQTGFVKEFGTMWTFDAPPLDYWAATYGFRPDAAWLDHVRLASVRLPGCSSSFVSADGLLMTNHHCARSCISAASPADTNYQETGFVARSRADEKPCPGLYVDQLQSMEDVTTRVRAASTARTDVRRVAQRDSVIEVIQTECRDATGLTCQIVSLYAGGMHSLYRYRRFSDLRLVMAPEEQAAFFGGDPDNFTYPRYDLDLSILRAYENGQPYHPEHFFTWSDHGAGEGEVVFVTGNPGSTGRLLTLAQMEYLRDVSYPARLAQIRRDLASARTIAERSEADQRAQQNRIFGLENTFKAISGYLAGLRDESIMARKAAFERDFRSRIAADPDLRTRFGGAWDAIARAQADLASRATQSRWYGFGGSQLMTYAGALIRLPEQAALPDSLRLSDYAGNGIERYRAFVTRDVPVDRDLERLSLTSQLATAQTELPADDPYLRAVLRDRSPEDAARALIDGTRLDDGAYRRQLLDGGPGALADCGDPLVEAALAIAPLSRRIAEREAPLQATIDANAALVGQAIFHAYGTSLPPDATFTLRISDGVVKGFPMNGTIAPYKTTMYGLFARSADFDNQPPFNLAPRWAARRDRLDLTTPIDFVATNDIIGGNSGSPVINRDAQIVGLIFDGNIEMLPNRFIFSDDVSRSVSVHSAGIIEALRKVYDAGWIADELQGANRP
ncbi:MAG TPA: S46 family peptidase [Gemmatimonadales bacterium]